jgi:hypothetical protein
MGDSHSIVLTAGPRQEGAIKGGITLRICEWLFSGPVFMPERIVLQLLGLHMVNFESRYY